MTINIDHTHNQSWTFHQVTSSCGKYFHLMTSSCANTGADPNLSPGMGSTVDNTQITQYSGLWKCGNKSTFNVLYSFAIRQWSAEDPCALCRQGFSPPTTQLGALSCSSKQPQSLLNPYISKQIGTPFSSFQSSRKEYKTSKLWTHIYRSRYYCTFVSICVTKLDQIVEVYHIAKTIYIGSVFYIPVTKCFRLKHHKAARKVK